jgi:hypothetical protein
VLYLQNLKNTLLGCARALTVEKMCSPSSITNKTFILMDLHMSNKFTANSQYSVQHEAESISRPVLGFDLASQRIPIVLDLEMPAWQIGKARDSQGCS